MANSQPRHTRWPWVAARAVLSAVALLWILRATRLQPIVDTLRHADLPWLVGGLIFSLAARLASAERTLAVSRALGLPLSRRQTIETLFISNFYSLLSPGPFLGGAVTIYRYRNHGASVSGSVSAVLVSRAMEFAAIVMLGTTALLIDPHPFVSSIASRLLFIAFAVLCASVLVTAGGWLLSKHRVGGSPPAEHHVERVTAKIGRVGAGVLGVLHRTGGRAALPAIVQALVGAMALALFAGAVGLKLSMLTALWLAAVVYTAVLLPISIMGLGVREAALVRSLAPLGVSAGAAVALSALLFLDPLLNAIIGGVWQALLPGKPKDALPVSKS